MKLSHLISAFVALLMLSACSTSVAYQHRTGFLKGYESLEKAPRGESHFFEKLGDVNLATYNKMVVPDIKVIANTSETTPQENELFTQISAYTSAAYRKNIMKNSANYTLVDVAQEGAMIMNIAISLVEAHPEDKNWDNLIAFPFNLNASTYTSLLEGNVRVLIEARITDAMSNKVLAHSMRVIMQDEVRLKGEQIEFTDLQASLDRWLNEAIVKH